MSEASVKVEGVTVPCAGCGGKVTFATNTEKPTILHTLPACERFESSNTAHEVVEYLHDCQVKLGVN